MHPYAYPSKELHFNLCLKEATQNWFHYEVNFPTAHPTRYEETNTAHGEYFVPRNGDCFPLAIFLHGIGDRSLIPCRMLARRLAKRGVASFMLYLVFHSNRMPKVMKGQFLPQSVNEWLEAFQVSVIDVRQVIDWAEDKAEIDSERIAVIGMSMGGLASAIAMGVDKRITAGVFITTGGNLEEITWHGKSSAAQKGHSCTREECHNVYSQYSHYLVEVAERGFENVTPTKECFLFDPMTFACYLRGRPILMINALKDRYIPRRSTLDLWEACDKPRIIWLPATHVTIYLQYPIIAKKITDFLKPSFMMADTAPG